MEAFSQPKEIVPFALCISQSSSVIFRASFGNKEVQAIAYIRFKSSLQMIEV
jgi:hypothetical protein